MGAAESSDNTLLDDVKKQVNAAKDAIENEFDSYEKMERIYTSVDQIKSDLLNLRSHLRTLSHNIVKNNNKAAKIEDTLRAIGAGPSYTKSIQ